MRANSSRFVERFFANANLAAVLEVQGRKQAWLAKRLEISRSLFCLIMGGAKVVTRPRGQQIADALGVPLKLLFRLRPPRNAVAAATVASDPGQIPARRTSR